MPRAIGIVDPNLVGQTDIAMPRHSALQPAPPTVDRQQPVAPPPERPATSWVEMYGLSRNPFAPDNQPAYTLFLSHRRTFEMAAAHLVSGRGVLWLSGEAGVGKSAMLQALKGAVAKEGVRPGAVIVSQGADMTVTRLNSILAGGERTLLLLDGADHMPAACRAELEALNAAEMGDVAILATVEEAPAALGPNASPSRPTVRLPRLTQAEMRDYIERSLWVAGGSARRLFSTEALRLIVARAAGLPGDANRLMEAAFNAAFVRGDAMITGRTMEAAIGARRRPRFTGASSGQSSVVIRAMSCCLFLAGIGLFTYRALQPAPEEQPPPPQPVVTEPQPQAEAPPPVQMSPDMMAALMRRGAQSLAMGDIGAARLLFGHAAEAGNAAAAAEVGKTYDPNFLPRGPETPDKAQAAAWYRKAIALGDKQAPELLRRLDAR